jgi:hypothetical protein
MQNSLFQIHVATKGSENTIGIPGLGTIATGTVTNTPAFSSLDCEWLERVSGHLNLDYDKSPSCMLQGNTLPNRLPISRHSYGESTSSEYDEH